jgi:hypothetical protein
VGNILVALGTFCQEKSRKMKGKEKKRRERKGKDIYIYFLHRIQTWWTLRKSQRVNSEISLDSQLQIEKINNLEVNTASGRYNLQL